MPSGSPSDPLDEIHEDIKYSIKGALATPQTQEKAAYEASSPAGHYSYYNVEDLNTPKAQFAIHEGNQSSESKILEAAA